MDNTLDLGIAGCGEALIELDMDTMAGKEIVVTLLPFCTTDHVAQSYSVPLIYPKDDTKRSKAELGGHVSLLDLSKLYSVHA